MEEDDLTKEFVDILGTIGGVSTIVLALSAWLGKVWAKRIAESERTRSAQELERLKLELDLLRTHAVRVSQAKFDLYSGVWASLQDVKICGDRLWERPTPEAIQQYIDALRSATVAIHRGRLLLRESDYQELRRLLKNFEGYKVGKLRLIEIATPYELEANFNLEQGADVRHHIDKNRQHRDAYEHALDTVANHFRQELRITA